MSHLYPVFLNLADKTCLIVGGGQVAERKAASLMEHEARVRLVSPRVEKNIAAWAQDGLVDWIPREFQIQDLEGVFMVFIATDTWQLNQEIASLCREQGILVNAVDDPPNCDFYVPSVLRRNSLAIAVSTEGKSPLYAARLRRELEDIVGPEHGEYVDILGRLRKEVKDSDLDITQRREIFSRLVDSDLLELIKAGQDEKVEERIKECMSSWQD